MTGGAYLPPEAARREGELRGGSSGYGRTGNLFGAPGIANPDIPGLAPHGMRPYYVDGNLSDYGVPGREDNSRLIPDKRAIGFERTIGPPSFFNAHVGRQDIPVRQEQSVVQAGGPSLGMLPLDASATLYVEGIPADCRRREAAHIFRPFIGFKEVRIVYKDAKRPGGDQLVLCFVDFADARCAATALEALQGYKLDENDHASPSLKLQFARVPGPRGAYRDNQGGRHDAFPRGR